MAKTSVSLRDLESKVGQEVGVSPWVEIAQQRIDEFAKATEDFQWIHVDPARAKNSPFGGTIAHGFLTLSMLPKLSESTFEFSDRKMGVNYGLNKGRRFPRARGSAAASRSPSTRRSKATACRPPGA
jgi:acyl dehydratase